MPITIIAFTLLGIIALIFMVGVFYAALYRKVQKGKALVKTGIGGTKVSFNGMLIFPVFHRLETIDISIKRIEVDRSGKNGLICKDNMRADIKVAFFVRVNQTEDDVLRVAQSIGCDRASNVEEIRALFDAKFSEALKTVGKRFNFIELYEERETFRDEIIKIIGTNLNGFILDDASIDYLEQTPLDSLDPDNILDAQGIKKITELTAEQLKLANFINRDREKVIKQQDVEAREAILELERQLSETEARQRREVETVQSRELAEASKVKDEQRQIAERARIAADEEIQVAEENKQRQVIVALRNKERTDGVELERVERERMLEQIERERVTELKTIEKEKAVEVERKNIQEVIKDRVALEKTVVVEQERIKDTQAFAGADRQKQVMLTLAEAEAQEKAIRTVKEAEVQKQAAQLKAEEDAFRVLKAAQASKEASELRAEERVIAAEAEETAAIKESAAKTVLAEGIAKETAATGMGEAEVVRAKGQADADAITQKAQAMKLFEDAGQEHEEFKLELEKDKQIELAQIDVQARIAEQQAHVLGEALKHAKIDIVGGEAQFFDRITGAITTGKTVDRMVNNSQVLEDVKETFFNGDPDYFKAQLSNWVAQFGVATEDLKNLSIAAVLGKLIGDADDTTRPRLISLLGTAQRFGLDGQKASSFVGLAGRALDGVKLDGARK